MRLKKISKLQKTVIKYDQEDLPDLMNDEENKELQKIGRLMTRMADKKFKNKTLEEINPLNADDYTDAYCYISDEKEAWQDAYSAIKNLYRGAEKILNMNKETTGIREFAYAVKNIKFSLHNYGSPQERVSGSKFSTISGLQMLHNFGHYNQLKDWFEEMDKDTPSYQQIRKVMVYFEDLDDALRQITLTARPSEEDVENWVIENYDDNVFSNFFYPNYINNKNKMEKLIDEHRADWQKILAYEIKKHQEIGRAHV
jgi:adenylate kinase